MIRLPGHLSFVALASSFAGAGAAVLNLPISVDRGINYIELGVGTPAKTHRLVFDSANSLSWVLDDTCASECVYYSEYARVGYKINNSSTASLQGEDGSINYSEGLTSGPIVSDLFSNGPVSWNQSFIAANESNLPAWPVDGCLSLVLNPLAGTDTKVRLKTLSDDTLDSARFGVQFGQFNQSGPGVGVLTIGGSRESEFASSPATTIPITKSPNGQFDSWRSSLAGITLSTAANQTNNTAEINFNAGNVIFDTSATKSTLPREHIEAFYEALGMNWTNIVRGRYVPQCSDFNSSWSITFAFGSCPEPVKINLTGDKFITLGYNFRDTACAPPFEESDWSDTVLGIPFLRNFYSVWDFEAKEKSQFKPTLTLSKRKDS